MKERIVSMMKPSLLFAAAFLGGAGFVQWMGYVDLFRFREDSHMVYAILYLAALIVCCKKGK